MNSKLLSGPLSLSVKLRTEMLLLVDLSVRRRGLYEGLLDAMVLYAALVDLVKVLFLMVVFLGRRCWVINVSLSRKSNLANHSNHGKRQNRLNSTDLLSHNNVGFSIFKWIKALRYFKILYLYFYYFLLLSCKEDGYFVVPVFLSPSCYYPW